MKYYIYKILWYNKYDDIEKTDYGIVAADTYTHAINNVILDYGTEEHIISIEIKDISDGDCKTLTINKAIAQMFDNGHNEKFVESYHLAKPDWKGRVHVNVPAEED